MSSLNVPVNKNEWYAMDAIYKIEDRTDIDDCEKRVLKENVKQDRENDKRVSNNAFQIQIIAFGVIIIQIFLLVFIVLIPSKNHIEPT
jgi:translation elongation factor EF-1beta